MSRAASAHLGLELGPPAEEHSVSSAPQARLPLRLWRWANRQITQTAAVVVRHVLVVELQAAPDAARIRPLHRRDAVHIHEGEVSAVAQVVTARVTGHDTDTGRGVETVVLLVHLPEVLHAEVDRVAVVAVAQLAPIDALAVQPVDGETQDKHDSDGEMPVTVGLHDLLLHLDHLLEQGQGAAPVPQALRAEAFNFAPSLMRSLSFAYH